MSSASVPLNFGQAAHPKSTACWHSRGYIAYGGWHKHGIVNGGITMSKYKSMQQVISENHQLHMEYDLGHIRTCDFKRQRKCLKKRMKKLRANRHGDAV